MRSPLSRIALCVVALVAISFASSALLVAVREGFAALPPLTYFARAIPAPGCRYKDPPTVARPEPGERGDRSSAQPSSEPGGVGRTSRPATSEELAAARHEQEKCRSAFWLDWWRARPGGSNSRPLGFPEAERAAERAISIRPIDLPAR